MGKTIAKFAYWAIAFVMGIVIYIGVYQVNMVEQVQEKISAAVSNTDYVQMARIVGGGLFDSTNLASDITSTKKYTMALLSGAVENSGTWYDPTDSLNARYYHEYDEAYYLYVFNLTYTLSATTKDSNGNDVTVYKSGVRFYSGDNYYDYYLNLTSDYNSSSNYEEATSNGNSYKKYSSNYNGYIEKATSEKELLLNSQRELAKYFSNYKFLSITISKDMIEEIETILGSDITAFDLLNGYGNDVSDTKIPFSFDFSESFYEKAKPVFDAYDVYLPIADKYNQVNGATYASSVSDNQYSDANQTLNTSIKEFTYKLSNKDIFTDYKTIYTSASQNEVVKLSDTITKSIVIVIIYVVAVVIVFFLIFYLKRITEFVTNRNRGNKNNYRPSGKNAYAPKANSIDAKVKDVDNKKEKNSKPEEVKEDLKSEEGNDSLDKTETEE